MTLAWIGRNAHALMDELYEIADRTMCTMNDAIQILDETIPRNAAVRYQAVSTPLGCVCHSCYGPMLIESPDQPVSDSVIGRLAGKIYCVECGRVYGVGGWRHPSAIDAMRRAVRRP